MQLSVIATLERTITAASLLMMECVKTAIPEETVLRVAIMTAEEVDVEVEVVAVVTMTDIAEL
jgi:enamine deaminase RidA (YjgF/YER057c/UK114 family)